MVFRTLGLGNGQPSPPLCEPASPHSALFLIKITITYCLSSQFLLQRQQILCLYSLLFILLLCLYSFAIVGRRALTSKLLVQLSAGADHCSLTHSSVGPSHWDTDSPSLLIDTITFCRFLINLGSDTLNIVVDRSHSHWLTVTAHRRSIPHDSTIPHWFGKQRTEGRMKCQD